MCPGAFTICFILFRATKSIAPMVQIEKRTSWRAVLCLILGPSFFLSVLFFASMPSDTPLPYREFRRIISVAPFVGVLLGHIAWRQIRSSEGRIGGFRLAISSFCSLKPPLPPRPIAKLLEGNKVSGAGDGNRTHVRSLGSLQSNSTKRWIGGIFAIFGTP